MDKIIAEGLSDVGVLRRTSNLISEDLLYLLVRNHIDTISLDEKNKALKCENIGFQMFGFS